MSATAKRSSAAPASMTFSGKPTARDEALTALLQACREVELPRRGADPRG